MEKTVCELFAGVGGFRLGLEKSSKEWKTVWFSQWEPNKKNQWAHECYVYHWDDIDENTGIDIALVDKKTIPDHNLLVGGFPCQDYSVAHSGATGLEGKKGVLWWQIRDILEEKKPSFVLLENVDRLLKSPGTQRGRDFGVMLACFASLDYSVEWRIINAADYGAGQRRKRTFIFAYKNNTKYAEHIKDQDILEKGFFARTFPIEPITDKTENQIDYADIVKVSENFQFNFQNSGYMVYGKIVTSQTEAIKEKPILLKELLENNVSDKYFLTDNIDRWEYLKGSKRIPRVTKSGHEYIYTEGTMTFPDSIDLPARTMLTSEATVNRSSHVILDPEKKKLRVLTPLEAERIQGFDDNWTNMGMPEKFRYFCMGNALVVSLMERIGKVLGEIFEQE